MPCHAATLHGQSDALTKGGWCHRGLGVVTRLWLHAQPPPLLSRLIYRPKLAVAQEARQLSTTSSCAASHPTPRKRLYSPAPPAQLVALMVLVSPLAPLFVPHLVQAGQPALLFVRGIRFIALHRCQSAPKISHGMDALSAYLNVRADQAFVFHLSKAVLSRADRKHIAPYHTFSLLTLSILSDSPAPTPRFLFGVVTSVTRRASCFSMLLPECSRCACLPRLHRRVPASRT